MQRKANPRLKTISIAFSLLLGITGCVLLVFGVMTTQAKMKVDISGTTSLWTIVIALTTICLSCVAALGAYKDEPVLLKGLIGMMSTGSVIMVITAFVISCWIITKDVDMEVDITMESLKSRTPYDPSFFKVLLATQRESHCCGVTGYTDYEDWETDVPSSCECSSQHQNTDRCIRVSSSSNQTNMDTMLVYKQACGQILLRYIQEGIHTALGAIQSLVATAFVGSLLCSALLCQISGYYKPLPPAEVVRMVNVPDDGVGRARAQQHNPASPSWP